MTIKRGAMGLTKTLSEPALDSAYDEKNLTAEQLALREERRARIAEVALTVPSIKEETSKDEEFVAAPTIRRCTSLVTLNEETSKEPAEPERKKIDQAELMSALTMISPSLVSMAYFLQRTGPMDWYAWFTFLNTFIHMPFSMAHHTNLALGDPNEGQVGWGLLFRRLDYTFIHVACAMLAYGLSRSELFGLAALIVNGYYIYKIFSHDVKTMGPQSPNVNGVVVTVGMYIMCISYYGRMIDCVMGAVMMASAFIVFKFNLLGDKYSHPAMHVLLGTPQIFFMAHSVDFLSF
ncbi:unnamed protein product [Heterosigma akashiwo]|uniref:Uncharacterized protein n=1 Tax=Heterosigma akashiwo TaxID=2829 RepID=A0A6V3CPR0_HETAK|mmetsp:Transcript_3978/g.5535  ORF Transcript_3978/g.5535 Transcript_3978/m.5535 type:complete len:292 (+) Transcript_3978:126-1001(+)|eukprot:CAMPEP_0194565396 /NCGR_PEP_ID=MMETSP0292-20121207/4680_1 /TAXON_ID=39354 /ORGANISM="Heterosigma akashiwo, Strain CCMP2393" /LENGTH=291 /DNA_ID=CAMNT_0039414741 /DNA_START=133 /DNA_END=1008 /DNA_ORIENTATION=+